MPYIPFGPYAPDVSDYMGKNAVYLNNVLARNDGYGPMPDMSAFSSALPASCRGFFKAIKSDGSVAIFGATSNRIFLLDNSALTWTPVSKVTALTSISIATPAVFTLNSHGLAAGDAIVLSTSGALPTGLTVGTVYYVISTDLTTNTFKVSATAGGAAVDTSGSQSGTHSMTYFYSAISASDQWQFVQFNNYVIAVQSNVAPQVLDLTAPTAFADLGGSPPQARYVSIVGRFVVLSGLLNNPYRVQWSGLNATTTWTSGTNSSDYQDLPDGGIVRGVAGGEYGYIFQDSAIRRMTYAPGSPIIFQIDRVSDDRGLYGPYSLVRSGDRILFLSAHGFMKIDPGGYPIPIGAERVDRTFFTDLDRANLQLLIGASDPKFHRVFWAYKSNSGTDGLFDKLICYNTALDRWSPVTVTGEFLGSMAQPGTTLENIDTISSSIDALTASLDSYATSVSPEIAAFSSSHILSFFRGSNLEGVVETASSSIINGRPFVSELRAITDATTGYGSIGARERWGDAEVFSTEHAMDSIGTIPARVSTRFARGRLRIPSGATWTFAQGFEAEATQDGKR